MKDILDSTFAPSSDAFTQKVIDEMVVLQTERGAYFGVNAVGTSLWRGLADGRTARSTCAEIAEEFGVSTETVEADARAFLQDLVANGIIEPA